MSKELDPLIVEKTIKTIVSNSYGIKLNDLIIKLCHSFMNDGFEVSGDEVQNLIYKMIDVYSICEISYVIDGRTRSFLLPARTEVTGNAIHAKPSGIVHIPPTPPRPKLPADTIRKEDDVGHTAPATT